MTEKISKYTILVVDDDPFVRRIIKRLFKKTIFTVIDVATAEEAMNSITLTVPDIILLDVGLPGMNGKVFAREMRKQEIDVPILVISGKGDAHTVRHLASLGVVGYVKKPFDLEDLRRRVGAAVANWRIERGLPADLVLQYADSPKDQEELQQSLTEVIDKFSSRLKDIAHQMESLTGEVEIMRLDMKLYEQRLEMVNSELSELRRRKRKKTTEKSTPTLEQGE